MSLTRDREPVEVDVMYGFKMYPTRYNVLANGDLEYLYPKSHDYPKPDPAIATSWHWRKANHESR